MILPALPAGRKTGRKEIPMSKYENILNRVLVTPYTCDNAPETCYIFHDPSTDRVCLTTCGDPVYYDSMDEYTAANPDHVDFDVCDDTYPSIMDYWLATHADLPEYGSDDSVHDVLRSCFGAGAAEWITSLPLKNLHAVQIGWGKAILDSLDEPRAEIARELLRLMMDAEDKIRQDCRRLPEEIADNSKKRLGGKIQGLEDAFELVTGMAMGQYNLAILLTPDEVETKE